MDAAVLHVSESARACKCEGSRVFMAGRRKVPFSEALASLQSLDPWNTKAVNVSRIAWRLC